MIKKYLHELVIHSTNIYSILSLLLGLFSFILLPLDGWINALILTFFAFTSILIAGYKSWRNVVDQLNKKGELSITCSNKYIGSDFQGDGAPLSPMSFKFRLDVINQGDEEVLLKSVTHTDFVIENDVYNHEFLRYEFVEINQPYANKRVNLPLSIKPRERLPNLSFDIYFTFQQMPPIDFAQKLKIFSRYKINLVFTFEQLDRSEHTLTIPIQETFDSYKQERIDEWLEKPMHQSVSLAAINATGITASNTA